MSGRMSDLFSAAGTEAASPAHRVRHGRPIRVLHVIRPGRGRAAKLLKLLLRYLREAGIESVVVASSIERGTFPDELRALGARVHVVDLHGALTVNEDLAAMQRIVSLLRSGHFDVIHLHGRKAAFVGRPAARTTGTRAIIYTPHGFHFHYSHSARVRKLHTRLERTLGSFTHAMICSSRAEADAALEMKLIAPERIHVRPDGVDFDDLPGHVEHIRLRRELGLNVATRLIAMTGRLDAPRDPGTLLRAARHVIRAEPRTFFVFVGGGEMVSYCRDLAVHLDIDRHVLVTGYREDALHIARTAAINVLSAQEGGATLSLLEDMAMGKVVVATDIPGIREVVTHGKTGVLFPMGDERILAGALLKLIGDRPLARRLADAGREYVREHHDPRDWARDVLDIYVKALRASARRRSSL